jgi:hypothetical protein
MYAISIKLQSCKMEAAYSFKMLVMIYQITCHHVSDSDLHLRRNFCKSITSYSQISESTKTRKFKIHKKQSYVFLQIV